jgi:hypothetical protein
MPKISLSTAIQLYKAALQLIGFGSEENHNTEISRKGQYIKL